MSDKERIAALEEIVHNLVEIVNWIKPKMLRQKCNGTPNLPRHIERCGRAFGQIESTRQLSLHSLANSDRIASMNAMIWL